MIRGIARVIPMWFFARHSFREALENMNRPSLTIHGTTHTNGEERFVDGVRFCQWWAVRQISVHRFVGFQSIELSRVGFGRCEHQRRTTWQHRLLSQDCASQRGIAVTKASWTLCRRTFRTVTRTFGDSTVSPPFAPRPKRATTQSLSVAFSIAGSSTAKSAPINSFSRDNGNPPPTTHPDPEATECAESRSYSS